MRFHAYRTRPEGRELAAVLRLEEPGPNRRPTSRTAGLSPPGARTTILLVANAEGVRIIDAVVAGSIRITEGTILAPDDLHEFCIALRAAGELSLRLRQGQELDELPWG